MRYERRTTIESQVFPVFEVGEKVKVRGEPELKVIAECHPPMFVGEETCVFVEGYETGFYPESLGPPDGVWPPTPPLTHEEVIRAAYDACGIIYVVLRHKTDLRYTYLFLAGTEEKKREMENTPVLHLRLSKRFIEFFEGNLASY